MANIKLTNYNYDTRQNEEAGEVSIYTLVHSMTFDNFVRFFEDYLNAGGKDYSNGYKVGKDLQGAHHTLQGLAIRFCLGVIVGLSNKNIYTDARNETPVAMGRKIESLIDDGTLNMGWMI